jgi:hypothetical protein
MWEIFLRGILVGEFTLSRLHVRMLTGLRKGKEKLNPFAHLT